MQPGRPTGALPRGYHVRNAEVRYTTAPIMACATTDHHAHRHAKEARVLMEPISSKAHMPIMSSRAFWHKLRALAVTAVAVTVAFLITPETIQGVARLVLAWDVGAMTLLAITWYSIGRATPEKTRAWAAADDPGQVFAIFIDLVGSAISFVAAISLVGRQEISSTQAGLWLVVVAVASSWALMHTGFTVRYAHLYYRDDGEVGGLDFPGHDDPDYLDFAYYSFVVGMTFQTADVSITDRAIRRLTLAHGMLSFVFNTLILALAVNLIFGKLA